MQGKRESNLISAVYYFPPVEIKTLQGSVLKLVLKRGKYVIVTCLYPYVTVRAQSLTKIPEKLLAAINTCVNIEHAPGSVYSEFLIALESNRTFLLNDVQKLN